MESQREKRKRDWQLQLVSEELQRKLKRQIERLLEKDPGKRTDEEARLLAENEELVLELASRRERRIKQKALQEDRKEEKEDSPSTLNAKLAQLCHLVKEAAGHGGVVVHTGAGLSTAAGIPDFRGPKGVWTLGAKGQAVQMSLRYEDARPTEAHMVIAALVRGGIVRHVVTQNVDGLHARSGVPLAALSELHGCVFKESCASCGAEYLRPFDVTQPQGSSYHRHKTGRLCGSDDPVVAGDGIMLSAVKEEQVGLSTGAIGGRDETRAGAGAWSSKSKAGGVPHVSANGRSPHGQYEVKTEDGAAEVGMPGYIGRSSTCAKPSDGGGDNLGSEGRPTEWEGCGSPLLDSIVHFGEKIDCEELEAARAASSSAGLALCLGTSLKVPPANKLPRLARKLVIVNLQWTAQDKSADLKINGRIEYVMRDLASQLSLPVPGYQLQEDPVLFEQNAGHHSEEAEGADKKVVVAMAPAPAVVRTTAGKAGRLRSRGSFPKPSGR